MSRSGKTETRSSPTTQEEQINLSQDELEKLRGDYSDCSLDWERQAQQGIISQRDLAEIKELLGVA
ncbi:hypothetical protein Metho_1192 [Methanomethylovorans hollandica DSM 15978]|uniref:Uncharacterized protein n=1 Tax=Methanomethylovorans hollandica (strain DSM 15978 / NBRC 107637 / DMS1) TaxID=867904 RepID=L0KVG5_METHD|nr:hypothetical protein [Methanomethylovorans hollandica]AGB49422.1 hypothetical protein Metho_1192 [Methanomethylovorans hollandica DSM 15978]